MGRTSDLLNQKREKGSGGSRTEGMLEGRGISVWSGNSARGRIPQSWITTPYQEAREAAASGEKKDVNDFLGELRSRTRAYRVQGDEELGGIFNSLDFTSKVLPGGDRELKRLEGAYRADPSEENLRAYNDNYAIYQDVIGEHNDAAGRYDHYYSDAGYAERIAANEAAVEEWKAQLEKAKGAKIVNTGAFWLGPLIGGEAGEKVMFDMPAENAKLIKELESKIRTAEAENAQWEYEQKLRPYEALRAPDTEIGQYGKGNIDLYDRPQYQYEDGAIATVESASFWDDNLRKEVLVPTIAFDASGNAVKLTDDEAWQRYLETGEYLGKFDTAEDADAYAEKLHKAQDFYYNSQYRTTANGKKEEKNYAAMFIDALGDDDGDTYYNETGYDDLLYERVNRVEDAMRIDKNVESAMGLDRDFIEQMTDDEIALFNYLYSTQNADAAYEYIYFLTNDLNMRQRMEDEDWAREYAQEHPVNSSIFSTIMSPAKGRSYLEQGLDYLADGEIDQNASYNRFSYIPTAIRGEVSSIAEKKWGPVGSFAYQTGMSMGDFLFNTAITGGNQAFTLGIMGTDAAADATISAKDRGLNDDQAFALGTIAGAAEIVTEKFSLDALFKGEWEKGALRYFLTNAFTEGSEEVASDFINLFADILISKGQSLWQKSINDYKAQDMSEAEAFGHAAADQAASIGLSFLGGAISGGILSGGNVAINATINGVNAMRSGSQFNSMGPEVVQSIIDEGMLSDPDTKNYRQATKLQGKTDDGKHISDYSLGRLYQSNVQTVNAENAARADQVDRLTSTLGENGKKAFTAAYEGEGGDLAQTFKGFAQVYNAVLNGTEVRGDAAKTLTQAQRLAAESSGKLDAALARKRSVKSGPVRDEVLRKAHLPTKTERTLDAVGKALGVQVRFAETLEDGRLNAKYEDETITIALDAEDPVKAAFTHEVVHRIREASPAVYDAMAKFVADHMSEGMLQGNLKARAELGYDADASGLMEETVADAFGRVLSDSAVLEQFVQSDRTMAQKALDMVRDVVNTIRRALSGQNQKLTQSQRASFHELLGSVQEMEAVLENAIRAVEQQSGVEGMKNAAQEGGGVKYSLKSIGGKNIVWIENSSLSGKQLQDPAAVARYIAGHIGEVYTIIESGQKVYIGKDLPGEYTHSKYTTYLRSSSGALLRAKNRATNELGLLIETATNRRWEQTKHRQSKDAKYGMYRYDSSFAFPIKDRQGSITSVKAYDVELLIRNASDGKKYLYDIVGIKENTASVNDLQQREARSAAYKAAPRGSASTASISSDGEKSNTNLSPDLSGESKSSIKGGEKLEKLVEQYGSIKPGEKPAREVQVPKKTGENAKVSQTVRTVLEAEATPEAAVPTIQDMVADGTFSYEAYSDEKAIRDASGKSSGKGYITAPVVFNMPYNRLIQKKDNIALLEKARAGDVKAAEHLLIRTLETGFFGRVYKNFKGAELVPVQIQNGGNAIPLALAEMTAERSKNKVFTGIHQVAAGKFAFDGETPDLNGRRFVLVDEVVSNGSSLKALADALESAGGKVVGTVALTQTSGNTPPSMQRSLQRGPNDQPKSDPTTKNYRQAAKLQEKTDAGKHISDYSLGRLYQENVQTVDAENAAQAAQADRLASTLGENGRKAFLASYEDVDSRGVENGGADLAQTFKGFTQVYNAALNGTEARGDAVSSLTRAQRLAAESSGKLDAALAKKGSVKSGLVWDSYTSTLDSKLVDEVDQVSRLLGIKTQFVDSVDGGIANSIIKDGVISIEKNNPDPVRFLFGHEITHHIQELSPESYQVFRDAALSEVRNVDDRVAEQKIDHAAVGKNLSGEEAIDEVVANYAGMLVNNGEVLNRFLENNRSNRTLLERVRDAFRALAQKLTGKRRGQVQSAEALLDRALEDAAKRAGDLHASQSRDTMTPTGTDKGEVRYSVKGRGEQGTEGADGVQRIPGADVWGENSGADAGRAGRNEPVSGAMARGTKSVSRWAQGHIVEHPQNPAAVRAVSQAGAYIPETVVVEDSIIKQRNPRALALTNDGVIYLSDAVEAEMADIISYHEVIHAVKQRKNAEYLAFLADMSEKIDYKSGSIQNVLNTVLKSRFPGKGIFDLTPSQADTIFDELNALIWGHHKADAQHAKKMFGTLFSDYDGYIADLDAIMEGVKEKYASQSGEGKFSLKGTND